MRKSVKRKQHNQSKKHKTWEEEYTRGDKKYRMHDKSKVVNNERLIYGHKYCGGCIDDG